MLLCGCVGDGSAQTPPSSAIGVNTEQLYSELVTAPNQLYAGFAIDTDSPVIPSLLARLPCAVFWSNNQPYLNLTSLPAKQNMSAVPR